MISELEAAIAFADREREEAYAAYRRALRDLTDADLRLLSARLDLADAQEIARTTDNERKARR